MPVGAAGGMGPPDHLGMIGVDQNDQHQMRPGSGGASISGGGSLMIG